MKELWREAERSLVRVLSPRYLEWHSSEGNVVDAKDKLRCSDYFSETQMNF